MDVEVAADEGEDGAPQARPPSRLQRVVAEEVEGGSAYAYLVTPGALTMGCSLDGIAQ